MNRATLAGMEIYLNEKSVAPDNKRWNQTITRDRIILEVSWFGVSFGRQAQRDGEWLPYWPSWSLSITKRWAWGWDHGWYDGPHCILSLGFLHYYRGDNYDCKKCSS